MADVVLAEFGGGVWLVEGDRHIDGLLAGTLPASVTVEFVACSSRGEVNAMWAERFEGDTDGATPWVINPLIIQRIKGAASPSSILFTAWSAMLDEAAQKAVANAADRLAGKPAELLTVRSFAPVEPAAGQADLQRLRAQLVVAAFARAGVDATRVTEHVAPAADVLDAERIDLVIAAPAAI